MNPGVVDTPANATLLSLFSPRFSMRYPDVRHAALIPESIRRAMEVSWNVGVFAERAVGFYLLEDVYVAEEGLVFDRAGRLFRDSITQHVPAEIERGHAAVQEAIRLDSAPLQTGTSVLCKKRGVNNFGHWMIEMLPMAFLSQMYLGFDDLRFVVPSVDGALQQVIVDSLRLLHIEAHRLLPCGPAPLRVERLVLVRGLSHHGVYMSPLVINCLDFLAARVRRRGIDRIFVTRSETLARRFVNEHDVQRRAEDRGYALIDPGSLPLAEQIAAFKGATDVVGVMGAGMTNIAFAGRGARIVTLAPAIMPDTFFWFISGLKGLNYHERRCRQSGPIRSVAPWDTDLELEPEDLDEIFPPEPG